MKNAHALILSADTDLGFSLACKVLKKHDSIIIHAPTYEKGALTKLLLLERYPGAEIHVAYASLCCLQEVYWMMNTITKKFESIECLVLLTNMLMKNSFVKNHIECHHIANILAPFMCVVMGKNLLAKTDAPKVILTSTSNTQKLYVSQQDYSKTSKKMFAKSNRQVALLAHSVLNALKKICLVDVYHCKVPVQLEQKNSLLNRQQYAWRDRVFAILQHWLSDKSDTLISQLLQRSDKAQHVYHVSNRKVFSMRSQLRLKVTKSYDERQVNDFTNELMFDTRL